MTCPEMTAGPSAPGVGPRENQPARAGSCGTSIAPSLSSPRSTSLDRTPILGMDTATGALIGVLMVTITELTSPHRLVRPLLGVGVLGGYTTFSTYSVKIQQMLAVGRSGPRPLPHRPGHPVPPRQRLPIGHLHRQRVRFVHPRGPHGNHPPARPSAGRRPRHRVLRSLDHLQHVQLRDAAPTGGTSQLLCGGEHGRQRRRRPRRRGDRCGLSEPPLGDRATGSTTREENHHPGRDLRQDRI